MRRGMKPTDEIVQGCAAEWGPGDQGPPPWLGWLLFVVLISTISAVLCAVWTVAFMLGIMG